MDSAAVPPLFAYLDALLAELQHQVPLALGHNGDGEAIHRARVATRRLKAALDLFRPVLSDDARRPVAKAARRLRRRLGPLRDLDVMHEHLRALSARQGEKHRRAIAWMTQRAAAQRERARRKSLDDPSPAKVHAKLAAAWANLRPELLEAGEAIDSLLASSIHLQLEAFVEQADRLTPSDGSSDSSPAQDAHELRISGKALRYTLEMARAHGEPLRAGVLRSFKRMQDALGLWHDFVVLCENAMRWSADELLAHHDTPLQADVLALARLALSRASQHLRRFERLWAKRGGELAASIRASVPLASTSIPLTSASVAPTADVSEPKTDPDPPATPGTTPPAAPRPGDSPGA